MVENKIELLDVALLFDEEETAEKLLGDGERSLPNLRFADLRENPLQNVRHLKGVREIRLVGTVGERLQDGGDVEIALHLFFLFFLGVGGVVGGVGVVGVVEPFLGEMGVMGELDDVGELRELTCSVLSD